MIGVPRDSPPLARGALVEIYVDLAERKLTPAGAGITHHRQVARRAGWTHSRWRGEHYDGIGVFNLYADSPPPARGRG